MSGHSSESFVKDRCSNSLFLSSITKVEIAIVISEHPSDKAPGYDGIGSFIIKEAKNAFAKPLVLLFNKSFITGVFPDTI